MTKEDLIRLRDKIDRLNIDEQKKRADYLRGLANGELQGPLTGYPSIDKVWLKHFRKEAEGYALDSPTDRTIWDVMEEKLREHYNVPAINYFGTDITRGDFIDLCYTWAKTFKAMGVQEDEIVPVYGPFVPDIAAMVFALNMIGAVPYFLKLAISPEALAEECKEAKIAVVFDGMWNNVAGEFTKDKYKKVIVASVDQYMPAPKKQIVSLATKMKAIKEKSRIPRKDKYIWLDDAKKISEYYTGPVKAKFVPNRRTFITSSSGTTVGGVVKGTVATNESALAQLFMSDATDVQFFAGDKCLNHFPPTASTSLNVLFLLPLYRGLTVMMDPRVSEDDFYNQVVNMKPNVVVNTGSMWEAFFNRVEKEMAAGKKFDFSNGKVWVVGGEGTDVSKIEKWNKIMKACNNDRGMVSSYGTSELFASACTEKFDARVPFNKPVMGVGVPYAGLTVGVFDEEGTELQYNQRGNLWIKGRAVMKEYYGKPELTKKTVQNGWVKTGDLAEIDEDGFVYIWGRTTDKITVDNKDLYLFDIAHKIKENEYIDDAIVLSLPTNFDKNNLVAHIVWNKELSEEERENAINNINKALKEYLPASVTVSAYSEHDGMLPYSPTTLKKDKNKMSAQRSGYVQVIDGKLYDIGFVPIDENGCAMSITEREKEISKRR